MSAEQMALLVRYLPQLQQLCFQRVRIDINAFAALSSAGSLHTLTLKYCASHKFEAPQTRMALPSLPHLTALVIDDSEAARLTAAEAEPLTQWILARCPKLTRASFKQNLLD